MADLTGMMQAAAGSSGGAAYQISRSLRFNSADSAYLSRSNSNSTDQNKFTLSFWMKRCAITTGTGQWIFSGGSVSGTDFLLGFNTSSDALQVANSSVSADGQTTTMLFRDTSAWYHVVVAGDSTQATNADRIKIYVNGVQQATSVTGTITLNSNFNWNANSLPVNIGRFTVGGGNYVSMYLAEIHNIDGQALTPSDFGEYDTTTGVWIPKEYTGTYGANGFYLDFSDNTSTTTLGYDAAGSNDWTLNNFSVAAGAGNDSLVDTPTSYGTDTGAGGEVRGNYATWSPIDSSAPTSLSNGNLNSAHTPTTWANSKSTISMPSGKWYFEAIALDAGIFGMIGVWTTSVQLPTLGAANYLGGYADGWIYQTNGNLWNNNSSTSSGISAVVLNDIINIAVDADAGKIWFGLNGSWFNSGDPAAGTNEAYSSLPSEVSAAVGIYNNASGLATNFGQRPFEYAAPSGFKALVTTNLSDPTVVQGDDYFNIGLYTGTGAAGNAITGIGFQPDFVWIKGRSSAGTSHQLMDAVRGDALRLFSNGADAEAALAGFSFDSDGFTAGTTGSDQNGSGITFVGWCWNAGGSNATNTDGTITSTVRANPTAGFSIVGYTGNGVAGATVGHGLGAAPAMIIVKNRDQADAWQVYHQANTANPETDYLVLNTTAATADALDRWNDTAPTTSVFSIGDGVEVNTNTEDYIAYVFAEIEGYSKFGSYTGNGSADGAFVYTGFRPAFLMIKLSSGAGQSWVMIDTKRDTYNVAGLDLYANLANAEANEKPVLDILSNGFKARNTYAINNTSTATYIYMAFAKHPFKYSLAR